jgi:hypothetical protein
VTTFACSGRPRRNILPFLYVDPKEEHAMLPLKQPIVPLLMPELARHVRTLQAFKPKATPRGLDALSVNSSK